MHQTIQALKSAMAYAVFSNEDIESGVNNLLTELGEDLEQEDATYDPGMSVERAQTTLEVALNDADEASEDLDDAIASASPEDGEDDDDDAEETK